MGDGRESLLPVPNYNTPDNDMVYKDLLPNIFTITSHCIGMKGSMWNVIWIQTLENQLTRKGLSVRTKNHYQHHVVLIANVSCEYRQKSGCT